MLTQYFMSTTEQEIKKYKGKFIKRNVFNVKSSFYGNLASRALSYSEDYNINVASAGGQSTSPT
jgi:hypothetical protein